MSKPRQLTLAIFLLLFSCPLVFAGPPALLSAESNHLTAQGGSAMAFAITTKAFPAGGAIPKRYTCDGTDVSPDLSWTNAPAGTKSFALIADDPDAPAGTWTHWVVWNIPGNATSLQERVAKEPTLGDGTRQGNNDFKRIGYWGPCPPPGKPHRLFFPAVRPRYHTRVKGRSQPQRIGNCPQGACAGRGAVEWNLRAIERSRNHGLLPFSLKL